MCPAFSYLSFFGHAVLIVMLSLFSISLKWWTTSQPSGLRFREIFPDHLHHYLFFLHPVCFIPFIITCNCVLTYLFTWISSISPARFKIQKGRDSVFFFCFPLNTHCQVLCTVPGALQMLNNFVDGCEVK